MASTGNTDRNKCIYEGSESGGMDIRWRIDRWTELKFYASPKYSTNLPNYGILGLNKNIIYFICIYNKN